MTIGRPPSLCWSRVLSAHTHPHEVADNKRHDHPRKNIRTWHHACLTHRGTSLACLYPTDEPSTVGSANSHRPIGAGWFEDIKDKNQERRLWQAQVGNDCRCGIMMSIDPTGIGSNTAPTTCIRPLGLSVPIMAAQSSGTLMVISRRSREPTILRRSASLRLFTT